VRHASERRVVEEPVVLPLDEGGRARREVGKRLPDDDQACGEPGRVDEGDEVARSLERRCVVVVEEEAGVCLEPVEGIEDDADPARRVAGIDEPEVVCCDDGEQAEPDARDVRVVTDPRVGEARSEPDVVDGERMLAVGERLETAPGVAREAQDEVAIAGRQRVPGNDVARRPARESRAHERSRRRLAAERGLPGLLPDRDDDRLRPGLDPPADHVCTELARLLTREHPPRERGHRAAGRCGHARHERQQDYGPQAIALTGSRRVP
jgi:hypothetical protein